VGAILLSLGVSLFAQTTPQPVQAIRDRQVLRVAALTSEVYPFAFQKEGQWRGFDVQLAAKIAAAIGVKMEWDARYHSEAELIQALESRQADVALSRLKRDLDAAQTVGYTIPYTKLGHVLLTNRLKLAALHLPDEGLPTLTTLKLKLGTLDQPGYATLATRRFPRALISTFPSMGELLSAVKSGQVDAAFCDEAEARIPFVSAPEVGIQLAYYPLPEVKNGVVALVPWEEKHWRAWLNILLDPVSKVSDFKTILTATY